MKFSLIKNDKSTALDELILGLISIVCLVVGICLVVLKPSLLLAEHYTVVAGVLIAMLGFMFALCVIYRLFTNDKKSKK